MPQMIELELVRDYLKAISTSESIPESHRINASGFLTNPEILGGKQMDADYLLSLLKTQRYTGSRDNPVQRSMHRVMASSTFT